MNHPREDIMYVFFFFGGKVIMTRSLNNSFWSPEQKLTRYREIQAAAMVRFNLLMIQNFSEAMDAVSAIPE